MPVKVYITKSRNREQLDARELVKDVGTAVGKHLGDSIVDGVSAVDGSPRERKANGKPRGLDKGVLARRVRIAKPTGSQRRAAATITAPDSRLPFLRNHEDFFALDGDVDQVIDTAVRVHLGDQRQ
jgi:hypothetical protein